MEKGNKNLSFHEEHHETINSLIDEVHPLLSVLKTEYGGENAYLAARGKIDNLKERVKYEEKTSCNGCSFCCHDTIHLSMDEADYIKKTVLEKGIIPNQDRIEKQKSGKPISYMDKACPLLEDPDPITGNRKCSIYEERPLICRTHNSIEPIEFCDRDKYPGRITKELRVLQIEATMMASIMVGKNSNYPFSRIPMVKLHEIL